MYQIQKERSYNKFLQQRAGYLLVFRYVQCGAARCLDRVENLTRPARSFRWSAVTTTYSTWIVSNTCILRARVVSAATGGEDHVPIDVCVPVCVRLRPFFFNKGRGQEDPGNYPLKRGGYKLHRGPCITCPS
jgi:hypothetical protein